ncbi:hypothetical protein [Thermoactinomyces sp. DSM 45892]|nr:hypothetical protein [Thermoactinomyces sp. DSM 45892]
MTMKSFKVLLSISILSASALAYTVQSTTSVSSLTTVAQGIKPIPPPVQT